MAQVFTGWIPLLPPIQQCPVKEKQSLTPTSGLVSSFLQPPTDSGEKRRFSVYCSVHTIMLTGCEHGLFTGAVNMVVCNSFMPAPLHVLLLLQQWKTKTSYICVCYTCHSTSCLLEKTITTLRHAKICTNIFHFPSSHWRINCLHVICV